jgi:hypothetical protein
MESCEYAGRFFFTCVFVRHEGSKIGINDIVMMESRKHRAIPVILHIVTMERSSFVISNMTHVLVPGKMAFVTR